MNTQKIETKTSEDIASNAYKELARYTAKTRSFPGMLDGLKTSYRRTLVQTEKYRKFTKSATLVGETMKTHVHGDSSIYGVLVNMACKYNRFPLFNSKGNFGGLSFEQSSSRYTEAYINDVARLIYLDLLDYADYEDGEVDNQEPRYLPSLLPYCFLAGSAGMTVGLPTPNIPALSPLELIDFCIAKLRNETPVYPHLNEGKCIAITSKNEIDNILKSGNGKVRFKPLIQKESNTTLVINEGTPGTDIDKSIARLSKYIEEEVITFTNETSEKGYRYVFTINSLNKMSLKTLESLLNKALTCTVTYRIIVEKDGIVYYSSLDSIIENMLRYLEDCSMRKFSRQLVDLQFRLNIFDAIESLKEKDILSHIDKLSLQELREEIIQLGYTKEEATEVSNKPIAYLTKEHIAEKQSLLGEKARYEHSLANIKEYLIERYQSLKEIISNELRSYCTRVLSEEELSLYTARKVVLQDNRIVVRKRGGIVLGDSSSVLLATKDCRFCRYFIPATEESEYALPENEYICMDADRGKYFAVLYEDKTGCTSITVNESSEIHTGLDLYIRQRKEGYYNPIACSSIDEEYITLVKGNGIEISLTARDYIGQRKRFPTVIAKITGLKFKSLK